MRCQLKITASRIQPEHPPDQHLITGTRFEIQMLIAPLEHGATDLCAAVLERKVEMTAAGP